MTTTTSTAKQQTSDAQYALLVANLLAARAAYNDAKFNGSSEERGRALAAYGAAGRALAEVEDET